MGSYSLITQTPIKTVGSTIDIEKFYLLNYVLWMYTPTKTLIVNWWIFVKYEPKSSQLKEPKS